MDNELNLLNKIGLTDTEAKVYLTLSQNGSLTGYEASKIANVPRSKIYNTLQSLIDKGFALYTQYESNNKYAAVPMSEVSNKIKMEMSNNLGQLEESFSIFPLRTNMDNIWHIKNYDNIFEKCRNIIKNSTKEILIQIWYEDLNNILEEIVKFQKKSNNIAVVIFGAPKDMEIPELKNLYFHGMGEEKKKEMGGRWITLVSDSKEVVFGQIISKSIAEVIWTESKPMVMLASEYVRHDVYFYKSANTLPNEMKQKFGDDLEKIRDIF